MAHNFVTLIEYSIEFYFVSNIRSVDSKQFLMHMIQQWTCVFFFSFFFWAKKYIFAWAVRVWQEFQVVIFDLQSGLIDKGNE